jgi:nicotinamidase-related amidase
MDLSSCALVVVDVQKAWDEPVWGRRNNPDCEANVARLIEEWRRRGRPIVFVRHDSRVPDSPLAPGRPGNDFKDVVSGEPDLLVTKHVNSAFYGTPDLHEWLRERELTGLVVCGITSDQCVSTTVRMGGNLGYRVYLADDAAHTYDRKAPDGTVVPADEIQRANAASLHGEFASVVRTADLLG